MLMSTVNVMSKDSVVRYPLIMKAPRPMSRLLCLCCLVLLAACQPPAFDLAITNVTVIDAQDGARENLTVLTRADTIAGVIPASQAHRALRTVDGSGHFLIPGLWDMHVHLTYADADADDMARLFLDYGITSVRDTGGLLDLVKPVADRLRAAEEAPRVFFGGPLMDGQFVVYNGDGRPEIGTTVPDPAAAATRVAELAAAGVDFIKIYEMVTPEVFDALVAAARSHGLPIASHVPLSLLASQAGPQVNSMEHLRNVEMDCAANYEELLAARRRALANPTGMPGAALRASIHSAQRLPAVAAYDADRCAEVIASLVGTTQVPTLRLNAMAVVAPWDRPDWDDALGHLLPEAAVGLREIADRRLGSSQPGDPTFGNWSLHLTGMMNRAGVPVGAGTDTPIGMAIPGYSLHNELDMLVRAGLAPIDALRAATVRPAEFLGLDDQMGLIQEGMRADLVLLGGNPLDDIANTRLVQMVVSKGRIVRSDD
jgi:cytosine/adenosine deaminase-related metal-dependent hydrolase